MWLLEFHFVVIVLGGIVTTIGHILGHLFSSSLFFGGADFPVQASLLVKKRWNDREIHT